MSQNSTMKNKDRILLALLKECQSPQIRVTTIRDQFIHHHSDENPDPAVTRRWINGKFTTLVNKGVLVRKPIPGSKKYYFEKTDWFDDYFTKKTGTVEAPIVANKPSAVSPIPSNVLHRELESYRQTMLSQLGEIEEYRRIRDQYPELESIATEKFQEIADENYRMIGRIRAIEKLMANIAH